VNNSLSLIARRTYCSIMHSNKLITLGQSLSKNTFVCQSPLSYQADWVVQSIGKFEMQRTLSFNEKLGFKSQPQGFATKAIHSGSKPEQWKSRLASKVIYNLNEYCADVTIFQSCGSSNHHIYDIRTCRP
jgi:hypothetical protein